ncbi:MAG: alpha-mannosidase, partial [Cyanobacteria bacterium P01_D01_bin.115]
MASADPTKLEHPDFSATIATTADRLRSLTRRSLQLGWQMAHRPDPQVTSATAGWTTWPLAVPNAKQHIAWERGQKALWLCQQITVPTALQDFPLAGSALRLGLTWWAETAAVYVDGQLVQEGDLFDYFGRILLSDRVTPGDTFWVAIYLVSPGHDDGALVRSEVVYEQAVASPEASPEPSFVADELTVLQTYAAALAPAKLADIAAAIAPLDWSTVGQRDLFLQELAALRSRLQSLSPWIKQRQVTCVGHAHLDLAWLWPVADTWQAAERTFRSVLALQKEFPELTYTHSSPALFHWLETHQPELFQTVQQAVQQGRWSIDAGLWVEPELNTLGGESLARQILYGQRYTQSRFGEVSAIAWLPDSFGFSWQLPQLLKLGGIDYFATQKLRWNETTTFPHSLFWWQGLDGTALLSLTLPPIGTDVDPVQIAHHSAQWEHQTGFTETLWLPGMGDHGGGPTRDMLTSAQRWAESPCFPQVTFASPLAHLQRLCPDPLPPHHPDSPLPVWRDELYLELHRGCYTVHADQKWFNRRCEEALREAELFAAIAHRQAGFNYPCAALTAAWQQVLFNQFHDILPGTAIPEVFVTANQDWQQAHDAAVQIRTGALEAIAASLPQPTPPHPDAIPLFLFNSLNWPQTDLVEIALSALPTIVPAWQVWDAQSATEVTVQISHYSDRADQRPGAPEVEIDESPRLLFLATVPAVGYRLYWLMPQPTALSTPPPSSNQDYRLENESVWAVLDAATGDLVELGDKATQTNRLRSPANQLQAFQDAGQYWDAWDIAPNYQDHPLPAAQLQSIQWLESGPLRQRLRVVRRLADSVIQQDYVLDAASPYLKVSTLADWRATQVVLKVAFPLTVEADHATYEIPFGAIARPTRSTDPHEQAKWEVPAYRWADLSGETDGLSILTDYKHGFDAKPDQLRLTLLKAPLWPDPQADRGWHQFTYALYPHGGDWRSAQTPHQAIAFNSQFPVVVGATVGNQEAIADAAVDKLGANVPAIASQGTFLDIGTAGMHLAALKLAEDADDQYILRLWELYGRSATLSAPSLTF